jgi:hypothetical protein
VVTLPEKTNGKKKYRGRRGGGKDLEVCVYKALIYHAKAVIGDFSDIACSCSGKHMRLQRLDVVRVFAPTDVGG